MHYRSTYLIFRLDITTVTSPDIRALLPGVVRRFPGDLAAVVAAAFLTWVAVYAPIVSETPVRVVAGLLFVLFAPGYAVLAALFPMAAEQSTDSDGETTAKTLPSRGLNPIERWTLSVAVSIATVVSLGLLIELSPWLIQLDSVFGFLVSAALVATVIAAWRRQQLPQERQLTVPLATWYQTVRGRIVDPPTRVDALLNVALVLALVFAAWGVGYGATTPNEGALTTVGLLAEQPDGEFGVGNYRTNLSTGDSRQYALVVTNQEYETVEYTVVVQLQSVQETETATTVSDEQRLDSTTLTLAHNQSRRVTQNVTLREPGSYRLNVLVYRDSVPADPDISNAYREVHLWLNVTASSVR